jgi:FemAB-related protein (PEP-CTERM system-associated)
MFLVRSLVYGRAIISLPFLNGGGIQADNDAAVAALLEHACTLSRRAGARYVELRGGDALPGLATETRKATVILPIHDGLETVWRRARPSLRNKVRKAEKLGVHVAIGTDLLSEFYGVYAQNMRRLGTPVFGKLFFETVVDQFRDDAQILVAYFENRPIGAKFVIFHKAACYFIWASSLREYSHCAPMDLLNWAAVREAVDRGCDICDFGRSNLGGSHMQFKQKWNGEVAPLPWHYLLNGPDRVPRRAGDDGRLALAARIWRLLPLPMANRLGPCLARHLP